MQNKIQEITEHFFTSTSGARELTGFNPQDLTITIKLQEYYGVGILNVNEITINESFVNVRLESKTYNFDGEELSFLVLISTLHEHKSSFARLCDDFVGLGENRENRDLLTSDPYEWWSKWKSLLGNISSTKHPYSVIAELWSLKSEIIKGHPNISWEGPLAKNHDLEGDNYHIEVKSSISQFNNQITVSNQFQLDSEIPLYLYLIKWQESGDGISINSLVEDLISLGYSEEVLEQNLAMLNYPKGTNSRTTTYRFIEGRSYLVDENFPIINAKSFKDEKIPLYVLKYEYTVDLSSFEYDTIDFR